MTRSERSQMRKSHIKGWCPSTRMPMQSGDGLVMRLKPDGHRMTPLQFQAVCVAAKKWGSGIISITNRANIQLRGLDETGYHAVISELADKNVISPQPCPDEDLNIILNPRYISGDIHTQLSAELRNRSEELPELPSKFGFLIDVSSQPCLGATPCDIRLEISALGDMILRAEGAIKGKVTTAKTAVSDMIALAHHFAMRRQPEHRRMAHFVSDKMLDEQWQNIEFTLPTQVPLQIGPSEYGQIAALPFHQCRADILADILVQSGANALRTTPFGMIILEGVDGVSSHDIITDPDHPFLNIKACVGAPYCASGHIRTQDVARALPHLDTDIIHISGCAKGCAFPQRADITLVGQPNGLYMIKNGYAWDHHIHQELSMDELEGLAALTQSTP